MHNASAKSALMMRERGSRLSAFLNSARPSLFRPITIKCQAYQ
jgi:hypothetical protein